MGGGRFIFRKRRKKWRRTEQKTIGIAGVSRGTGTTFCMMMMAYYIRQVIKAKTAVIERNATRPLLSICEGEEGSMKGIDILGEQNTNIMSLEYSYLFFDYGTRIEQTQSSFPKFSDCAIKFITANINLWRQEELFHFVETWSEIQGNEDWIYLIPFASASAVRKIEKQLSRKMYVVAPEQEWWHMGVQNLALWDKILRE